MSRARPRHGRGAINVLSRRQHAPALEHATQAFNVVWRPIAQIEQGPLLDLVTDPIALAQQDGGRRVTVGNGFDVHGRCLPPHYNTINQQISIYMATYLRTNKNFASCFGTKEDPLK